MTTLDHDNKNLRFISMEVERVTLFESNPPLQVEMLEELIQELVVEKEKLKLKIIHT